MHEIDQLPDGERSAQPRRGFIKAGGALALGAGAYVLAACETSGGGSPPGAVAGAAGSESVLDRWVRTKTAKLGVDLTFPPIQFKDSNGKPTGYQMEVTQQMMSDLGVTPEYVEIPFGQLFAALAAGKFDMMGISATILPSRALRGYFAQFPCFYESIVVLLKPGSSVTSTSQLASANISVLQGSSQEFSGKILYPKATFQTFAGITDAINAVATGRADAVILSEFDVGEALKAHPDLKILPGPPLFVDANTYFMPVGDQKLQAWVTNWLRYYATHGYLTSLWQKWVGTSVAPYHLNIVGVGPGGEASPLAAASS
jgi:polar amino acid transport system substrate-binding protein